MQCLFEYSMLYANNKPIAECKTSTHTHIHTDEQAEKERESGRGG